MSASQSAKRPEPAKMDELEAKGSNSDDGSAAAAEASQERVGDEAETDNDYPQSRLSLPGELLTNESLISAVEIHIISPSHSRTLPSGTDSNNSFQTLALLPQSHETIQELKLAVNEYVGGYWLGPYSLRIPNGHGSNVQVTEEADRSGVKTVGVVDVKEGEKLSDWLEVGHVFKGFEPGQKRLLEVCRGESAPYDCIRLR